MSGDALSLVPQMLKFLFSKFYSLKFQTAKIVIDLIIKINAAGN
jgi:hypothetical protein